MDKKNLLPYVFASLILFLFVTTFSVLSFASSYAKSSDFTNNRTFSVSAEGKVMATPDVAQFSFTILNEGETVADLQATNNTRQQELSAILKEFSVKEEDIRTESYSVEPRYGSSICPNGYCPPASIDGYTVSQTTSVKVRDFDVVGQLLTAIASKGVDNLTQLSFVVDDKVALENEARAKAIDLGEDKAKSIAKAAGFKLGKLTSIYESTVPYYKDISYRAEAMVSSDSALGMGGDMAAVSEPAVLNAEINPGTEEIKVNVNLTYSMR